MQTYNISPKASEDLDKIWTYIARQSGIGRAEKVIERIRLAILKLAQMPGMGHQRDDLPSSAFRAWSESSFLIIYLPDPQPIRIVRILAGQRDLRGALDDLIE